MSALDRWLREGWLRAVDHALGATLQRLRPDTPDAVALAAALASRALEFGHSGVPLAELANLFAEIAPERALPALPPLEDWRAQLLASPFVGTGADAARGRPLVFERERIALRRYWDYEVRLASALRTLATPLPAVDTQALQARVTILFGRHTELDRQALAAVVAQQRRLLLLTGGPGTGKTSTVARILAVRIEQAQRGGQPLRIALAAPTGKAAARLAEAVRENAARLRDEERIDATTQAAMPAEASTLHRLLGWQPNATTFRQDAAHPLPFDLVVVDEASMVDLPLMCKLVEAISPQASLILLGDRDQLPSVETGDVLAALCDAAGDGLALAPELAAAASVLLGTEVPVSHHQTGPLTRVELARSYRQSSELDLAPLATAIRSGDIERALDGLRSDAFRGLRWRSGTDAALAEGVLERALPRFFALAAAENVAAALDLARRFRVLTALREGPAGSAEFNARIAQGLQGDGARAEEFFHGRLVMVRENSYRHGLYNGDIGLCWRDADVGVRVWFDGDGGPRSWLPAALPRHQSAFALTVHKAQGSEFDEVLLAFPARGARVLSRELLYTGLTRARSALTLWAGDAVLADAIARRAQRWSGLADRLRTA